MAGQGKSGPIVSVIVPTFNRLRFLRATVDSVFAQSLQDWELIIADDGSDEETRYYLRALAQESRVKIVLLQHTGMPAVVRNAALRVARGEYVAFLDSDDLWLPDKLVRQLDVLQAHPSCQWSYTAFSQIDSTGMALPSEATRRWEPYQGAVFELMVLGKVPVRTPGVVLATRQILTRVGGFDETIRSAEDYDLWLRLAHESNLALVNEPLTQVRCHDDNYSRAWESAFSGRDRALHKMQERVTPARRALLKKERVRNALKQAAIYMSLGDSVNATRALQESLSYCWNHPRWWYGALKTLLKPHLPRRLLHP